MPVADTINPRTSLVPRLYPNLTGAASTTLPDEVVHNVLEELCIKLICGQSRTDLEEHLQNAAKLNPQIPTESSAVLKLLKQLGYKRAMH